MARIVLAFPNLIVLFFFSSEMVNVPFHSTLMTIPGRKAMDFFLQLRIGGE